MTHYDRCPLCSSEKILLFLQTNDFFLSKEPFPLFRCYDCSFLFTQDHPEEKDIGSYYDSKEYFSHNDNARGLISFLYKTSRSWMQRKKCRIVKTFSGIQRGNILDVGCGTGHFLAQMKKAGWNTKGTEINEKAREYARSMLGIDASEPEIIYSLPSGSFNTITLWHVLEHIYDPSILFSEFSRLLSPDGTLIVALPNCNSADAKHYRKFWAAFDVPRHIWHFSPDTFLMFARKNGFNITSIRRLPLDVFYISILSEKYFGKRFWLIKGIIMGLKFFLQSAIDRKKSSSVIYKLKKG
jgi:SAM-dependent methyltransferase